MQYGLKNGDMIQFDLRSAFPNATVFGEYFEDENGNIEIYIPEGENHTSFYIKIPQSS